MMIKYLLILLIMPNTPPTTAEFPYKLSSTLGAGNFGVVKRKYIRLTW